MFENGRELSNFQMKVKFQQTQTVDLEIIFNLRRVTFRSFNDCEHLKILPLQRVISSM